MNAQVARIYDHLLQRILEKEFPADAPLPSEPELARAFATNRANAHGAVVELRKQGLLYSLQGKGTFVRGFPSPALLRRAQRQTARRVHVVLSEEARGDLGRVETVFASLGAALGEHGYALKQSLLPQQPTRPALEKLMAADSAAGGSSALVFLATTLGARLLEGNLDLLLHYQRDLYLFDIGGVPLEGWPFNAVSVDPFGQGLLAGQYLVSRGWRRIVLPALLKDDGRYWARRRLQGLDTALAAAADGHLMIESWPLAGGTPLARLRRGGRPPAVVALNDHEAARLLDSARAGGLNCPNDFAVISFDDNPLLRHYNLTTVAPRLSEAGMALARLIMSRPFPEVADCVVNLKLPSHVIERETCRHSPEA